MTSSELLPKNEDVRLTCAFISDAEKRTDAMVLYAFLETLRDIPERVTEPLMGEIRLRWWYEAIEEIRDGRTPRYHPLTEALQRLIGRYALDTRAFLDLIEGQMPLLDAGPLSIKSALGVVDSGDGMVANLVASIIDKAYEGDSLVATARYCGMARLKAVGRLEEAGETERAHLKREATKAAKGLSSDLMPLALPAALADGIWRGRSSGPLGKRVKLFWAFVTGNI